MVVEGEGREGGGGKGGEVRGEQRQWGGNKERQGRWVYRYPLIPCKGRGGPGGGEGGETAGWGEGGKAT